MGAEASKAERRLDAAARPDDVRTDFVVIGGGPAGLTAAYELSKASRRPVVVEKQGLVGGLARTEVYKGFHFDMGGHRFFTKAEEVKKMWREVLGDQFLRRPRLSRIYYRKKFFDYPLKPLNALKGLGLLEGVRIALSYLRWQIFPYRPEETFEQWVTNRFGRRLFLTFFKAYTEKVWGIPCSELKAEWAAQRIKDLSLRTAVLSMLFKPRKTIKTLIEEFDYPRLGPGMMWNAVKKAIEQRDGTVMVNCGVVRIERSGNRLRRVIVAHDGVEQSIAAEQFLSSMPITEFVLRLDPPPPPRVAAAAKRLTYRDFLTVCLIVNQPDLFPDNWIYIQDPEVQVGRIQNFKNWSPDMVPEPSKSSLGLEYFCTEGDRLWSMPDHELIDLGKRELERIGLARACDIEDGCVFRVDKAYPVYDSDYQEYLEVVKDFVAGLENFQTVGRNGLHRYNNQDHAMLTGMLAVRNVLEGERNDLWSVNADQEYLEEMEIPEAATEAVTAIESAISQALVRLDRTAFGLSTGALAGIGLFAATLILVLKGGPVVGPNLRLLGEFFPGYRVTLGGSFIGLAYGFLTGFVGGWSFAFLRNASVFLYITTIQRRVERRLLRRMFEYV
jgi:protoporphyrinogen oxidase